MIATGLTISPIELYEVLKKSKIQYSVNQVGMPNILILGLEKFVKLKPSITKQRCLIFDTKERLQTIKGLPILLDKNPNKVVDKIKNLKSISLTGIENRNYIFEYLEKNKDKEGGFLHLYNTNIYKISQKPSRELIKMLFLSLLNGKISETIFKKEIAKVMPKKGQALIATESLIELSRTESFKNMQECIQKAKTAKHDREIEKLATTYDIAAFDIRYLLSTLKQT